MDVINIKATWFYDSAKIWLDSIVDAIRSISVLLRLGFVRFSEKLFLNTFLDKCNQLHTQAMTVYCETVEWKLIAATFNCQVSPRCRFRSNQLKTYKYLLKHLLFYHYNFSFSNQSKSKWLVLFFISQLDCQTRIIACQLST